MYCPKCGTHNNEDTKFCRSCGTNLSLVPQAITGKLEPSRHTQRHKDHKEKASLGEGITKAFLGLGFLIVAIVLWVSRQWWGIWMLIPAFGLLGKGIAEIVSFKYEEGSLVSQTTAANFPPAQRPAELPRQNTGEMLPPPSVTEGTTRHLDPASESYKETR